MGKKETINDRVRILRKEALGMTQIDFAKKLRITHSQISAMELGKSIITEQNIMLICYSNKFDEKTVNEEWLRNGKGEIFFTPAYADGRPKLFDDNNEELPPEEEELIGVYRELMPGNKKNLRDTAKVMLGAQKNTVDYLLDEKGERRADTSRKSI